MKSYLIKRANGPVPLCGDAPAAPWKTADLAQIDQYPWYKAGAKQVTNARAVYDDKALYLQFLCEDRHIFSRVTETGGNVCNDSCVEFFATIDPDQGPDYFNIETNCCGTRLMGFGPQREGRRRLLPGQAERIQIVTSIPAKTRDEQKGDNGWWAAIELPFDFLSEFTGRTIAPKPGTRWRANFYRCGGKTEPQCACWNPIEWKTPDYHRPEFFGDVRFE